MINGQTFAERGAAGLVLIDGSGAGSRGTAPTSTKGDRGHCSDTLPHVKIFDTLATARCVEEPEQ